ncbi:pentatricopeptide repeat-containing protein At3g29290 isoform X2 [Punica granatum]|uniref:Pentatricopeptide repeat-containing protein At3g29290 isoform X2 n=1 Tax=Punica granatum TaxID=22663 RepID=A0A6P8D4Y6_PUNGR|nr:pentatricopeptide repeat-containing protein At3g29290 isoform X2 [Punica granatum]
MVECLKNPVCYSRSSCPRCCCCYSIVPKSRPSEVLHKVYMIPITKLRASCFSSPKLDSYVLVKSVANDNVEHGFMDGELDGGKVLSEESEGSERVFTLLRDAKGGDVDSPSAVHTELVCMSHSGMHFLEETDEEVLSERVLVLSRTNKVRSAFILYKSMELSGLYPNKHACNSLLSCLLRRGLLDDALKVFKSMRSKGASTGYSYSLILKAVADAQDNWMQCEKLWESMKENGHKGTAITYSLLVSIFVRCGQNELALQAYHEMVQRGLKPGNDVLQAVMKACTKEGKWELALSVFETMLANGQRPNLISCNALMNCLGKAGEVGQAFKVYDIMRRFGHEPDGYTLNALVGALYRANRPSDALRLFDSVSREKGFHPNLHVYNTALMSCSKLRSWDRAVQILWQMEASWLSVPVASYNLVIATCEVARKPKVALQVYQHMIDKNCSPDTFTNQSILRSCIWGSLWDKVEEILKGALDASLYNTAIQGMCLRGKIDLAKTLYRKMREKGFKPDGKTRALMLQKLTRN